PAPLRERDDRLEVGDGGLDVIRVVLGRGLAHTGQFGHGTDARSWLSGWRRPVNGWEGAILARRRPQGTGWRHLASSHTLMEGTQNGSRPSQGWFRPTGDSISRTDSPHPSPGRRSATPLGRADSSYVPLVGV